MLNRLLDFASIVVIQFSRGGARELEFLTFSQVMQMLGGSGWLTVSRETSGHATKVLPQLWHCYGPEAGDPVWTPEFQLIMLPFCLKPLSGFSVVLV